MYDVPGKKRARCGICDGCRAEDCGTCPMCLDKPKYGGPGKKKNAVLKENTNSWPFNMYPQVLCLTHQH